jgi:hypothetical protein
VDHGSRLRDVEGDHAHGMAHSLAPVSGERVAERSEAG